MQVSYVAFGSDIRLADGRVLGHISMSTPVHVACYAVEFDSDRRLLRVLHLDKAHEGKESLVPAEHVRVLWVAERDSSKMSTGTFRKKAGETQTAREKKQGDDTMR